jgi:hypothetical protein
VGVSDRVFPCVSADDPATLSRQGSPQRSLTFTQALSTGLAISSLGRRDAFRCRTIIYTQPLSPQLSSPKYHRHVPSSPSVESVRSFVLFGGFWEFNFNEAFPSPAVRAVRVVLYDLSCFFWRKFLIEIATPSREKPQINRIIRANRTTIDQLRHI